MLVISYDVLRAQIVNQMQNNSENGDAMFSFMENVGLRKALEIIDGMHKKVLEPAETLAVMEE